MRTFILSYDRQGAVDAEKEEIINSELLNEIVQLLVKEGVAGGFRPVASTLIFTCDNKYTYRHWEAVIAEFNSTSKIFFALAEVYQGASRHLTGIKSSKISQDDFKTMIDGLISKRTSLPAPKGATSSSGT